MNFCRPASVNRGVPSHFRIAVHGHLKVAGAYSLLHDLFQLGRCLALFFHEALLLLVVLSRWQIFASERESQTCRTLVSFRSPERTFFALKFGELLVDSAHEVFARLIRERNDPFPKCGLPFSGAGFSLWCFHERTPF